jgi:hypothetical protein
MQLLARAVWDEDREEWILQPAHRPVRGSPLAAWRMNRLPGLQDQSFTTPDGFGMEEPWPAPGRMSQGVPGLAWGVAPEFMKHPAFPGSCHVNQVWLRPHVPAS